MSWILIIEGEYLLDWFVVAFCGFLHEIFEKTCMLLLRNWFHMPHDFGQYLQDFTLELRISQLVGEMARWPQVRDDPFC